MSISNRHQTYTTLSWSRLHFRAKQIQTMTITKRTADRTDAIRVMDVLLVVSMKMTTENQRKQNGQRV